MALDVESLYNAIPHDKGIEVIQHHLDERGPSFAKYNIFVLELLDYILKHNVFQFDSSHYPQVQGVAMGTKCAPSYANLYLGGGKRSFFQDRICFIFMTKSLLGTVILTLSLFFGLGLNLN